MPEPAFPAQVSREISDALLAGNLEAAANKASSVASGPPEAFKTALGGASSLGKGEYSDLVYIRTYGRTGQDIIYKLRFLKTTYTFDTYSM
jgi:hypothetical protein